MEQFQDVDDEHFDEKCSVIAQDIQRGVLTVVTLIERLGILLTDSSASKRELGVAVLSRVLKELPRNCLNVQELTVISTFYTEKLRDYHQVVPVTLKGILTLIEFENFPGDSAPALLNSLFHNVSCQQQQQSDRYTIFKIFELLAKKFPKELLSMKLEFVYGVLQSIDGERDPRNLLFLFKWLTGFFRLVSLGHLAEDFFEVLACYFPVDFRAPPSENSITRDVLADALLPCLTALPDFGEFCVPLALEKLDSSLKIAKVDSLKLLKEGCNTFDASVYLDKAPEIFSQLQKEIFGNPPADVRSECLQTMTAVINKISRNAENLTRNIVDTLKGNLIPDSKFYQHSESILCHVALGSEIASECVAKEIVPILVNMYVMSKKSATLRTLVNVTRAYLKYHASLTADAVPEIARVPLLCVEAMNHDRPSRKVGCDSLTVMAEHLSEEARAKLYRHLRSCVRSPSDDPELRKSELGCVKSLALRYPGEVKSNLFGDEPGANGAALTALTTLAQLSEFRAYVVDEFSRHLRNEESVSVALDALKRLLERERGHDGLVLALLDGGLLDLVVASGAASPDASKILKLLMGPLDGSVQRDVLRRHLGAVCEKTAGCHAYVPVLDGLVAAVRRDVPVGWEVIELALEVALRGAVADVRGVAMQLLANLINKRDDEEVLNQYLDKLKEVCLTATENSSSSILTMFWITKGLVMRNSSRGMSWLDSVLKLLDEHNEVVEGLEIIMNDDYESLSSTCHCNKLLIYRQKVFVYITNRISENYSTNRLFYSKATACLLKHTPLQAIILQFKKIYKLILLCMETEEPEDLSILLNIIKDILLKDCNLIEDHLEDFLTRLLRLTTFKNSMQVRIKAVQCLVHFTSLFPLYKLIPFKSKVLHCLGECIDDKKRLVRREAVEARSLWFLMDAPI